MRFSIQNFVREMLRQEPETRFTARQIAEWIIENFPEAVEDKRQRSRARKTPLDTNHAMLQQIIAEIGAQRPNLEAKFSNLRTTEGRPRKYFWTTKSIEAEASDVAEIDTVISSSVLALRDETSRFSEHDLYPILSEYLFNELGIHSKRVDERKSRNLRGKGGNKWLFPDLVGMEDLSKNWSRETLETAREYQNKRSKLWSFEVKLIVNTSNVREVYFQAVSNSSWANVGYLVASEIQGSRALRELQVLSNSHGIGVIKLDPENVTESQILIPANERPDVDWDSANRLIEENKDFVEFIRLVRQFYQTGDPRPKDWDYHSITS